MEVNDDKLVFEEIFFLHHKKKRPLRRCLFKKMRSRH